MTAQASIYGRLGGDPKAISTRTGNSMAAGSLAVDLSEDDAPCWFGVVAFGRMGGTYFFTLRAAKGRSGHQAATKESPAEGASGAKFSGRKATHPQDTVEAHRDQALLKPHRRRSGSRRLGARAGRPAGRARLGDGGVTGGRAVLAALDGVTAA